MIILMYIRSTDESSTVRPSQQTGVFRTNCIDCLDRTNVVQSLIARRSLEDQLVAHKVVDSPTDLHGDLNLEDTLRNIWADNGDTCSLQYAGTGALKVKH